jgi:hypothetical protein
VKTCIAKSQLFARLAAAFSCSVRGVAMFGFPARLTRFGFTEMPNNTLTADRPKASAFGSAPRVRGAGGLA